MPDLAEIMDALLTTRQRLREEFSRLHRKVLEIAKGSATCTRLMTLPGVGPVTLLSFISTIDVPARFRNDHLTLKLLVYRSGQPLDRV
nr:IS110 family transposase [Rhizobium sp. P28RR-XV]